MSIDVIAMTPPDDPAVQPHAFLGRPDRWCEVPGCDRPDRNPIHRGSGPDDPRVGRHPYAGPAGDDIRACDLPGCGRRASNAIHDSAPAGSRILEAAKAVARAAQLGRVTAAPGHRAGSIALALLDQALTQAGHPTRPPSLSERAMAEVDRLRHDDPEAYQRLARTIARDVVTQPEHRPESLMADGTTAVLDDYQHRGQ